MVGMPIPVRLFHITVIDNLAAIFEQGALLCKARSQAVGIDYQNIAHAGAQGVRASKAVIDPPGGYIHDYVPFYFAPRSPMLMAIHGGKVQACHYQQNDIVYFELLVRTLVDAKQEFVFYDRNATKDYSQAFTDPHKLKDVVDWELLTEAPTLDGFCKYFQDRHEPAKYMDRMEKRQAEFLVKDQVPLAGFIRIGVINEEKASVVRNIMARYAVNLPVQVMPDWYFLGQ
jgi:ssDNA thymidine ADP-ribosyltransferase, DarT